MAVGHLSGVGQKNEKASVNTLQLMVHLKECQEDMRFVVGQWCISTTTKKRSRCMQFMVRCVGVGSAVNDQKSRVVGLHRGAHRLDGSLYHP